MDNKRFSRTAMMLGTSGIKKLSQAKVMIIGLGAVGGYVMEALARAGIGNFVVVDFDIIETSNINRQILALSSTVGQKKTFAAQNRIKEINPDAVVEVMDMFVNAQTIPLILAAKPDFVVDAIDALNPKCDLIQALVSAQIPFISSMGAALKTDSSKIKLGHLSNSKNCPLAKFIRKRLRKRGVDISNINCVWSEEQINLPEEAIAPLEDDGASLGRARRTLGSLPTITAIFGLTIANQIILELSGFKK